MVVAGKYRRYGMAPAQILVFLSQKTSTENGQFRVVALRLAWDGAQDKKQHHGGNTFAGGTGGADTAGLGGVGGPYRLAKSQNTKVEQLSDKVKAKVRAVHVLIVQCFICKACL